MFAISARSRIPAVVLPLAITPSMKDVPAVPILATLFRLPIFASDANADPAGAEVTRTVTVNVSPAVVIGAVNVTGILAVTPTAAAGIVPTEIAVGRMALLALEGAVDNVPKPKAATVTSAMPETKPH